MSLEQRPLVGNDRNDTRQMRREEKVTVGPHGVLVRSG